MISGDAIRGYIDIMILSILQRQPTYAYQLSKLIQEETGGEYEIKQTTLYSAVKRLEASGAVTSFQQVADSGKLRTYYELTALGFTTLRLKAKEWEATKSIVDRFVEGI